MKYSKQREIIKDAVQHKLFHPTAEEVYACLKPEFNKLSLGTVYRNLNQLAECGEIKRIPISGASERFDPNVDEHYHMICRKCREIFDLNIPFINLKDEIFNTSEFTPERCEFVVYGLCKECLEKEEY